MVAVSTVIGYGILLTVHTAIAAIATRFFRIRLTTRWGAALYAALLIPLLLVVSTMLLSGPFGIGTAAGDRTTALVVVIGIPLTLGIAIDLLWMPHPDEVELPDTTG
ncbi:hypothetical protein ACFQL3_02575 [Natronoarchaeum sp. GCM10025321]